MNISVVYEKVYVKVYERVYVKVYYNAPYNEGLARTTGRIHNALCNQITARTTREPLWEYTMHCIIR
jgi:hypothetical protein